MACVICIVCTAVRSAVLATAVLIVCDFLSIRNISKKAVILVAAFLILVFLATNTDILTKNPLIEKTLYATEVAGSITNGRELYRQIALSYYATKTDVLEKILGVGITGVVEAIYSAIRVRMYGSIPYDGNAVVMEKVAEMDLKTLMLNPNAEMKQYVLDKHYMRKHGPNAYYGQK